MTWFELIKLDNVDVARLSLEGPPTDNPSENYDVCCELAREAAERVIKNWTGIGPKVLETSTWKNYNCENLRKELEMFDSIGCPNIRQVLDAWDKCAEKGGANDLV